VDEYVDVIDENDNELGYKKLKSEVHKTGEWHRGAHLWIIKDGKILLQKRSANKDIYPNCFDISCAGHVSAGEKPIDTIIREAKEELSLDVNPKDLIFLGKRKLISENKEKGLISREVNYVYLLDYKGKLEDLKIDNHEVSEIKLFDINELKKLIREKPELFANVDYMYAIVSEIEKAIRKDY